MPRCACTSARRRRLRRSTPAAMCFAILLGALHRADTPKQTAQLLLGTDEEVFNWNLLTLREQGLSLGDVLKKVCNLSVAFIGSTAAQFAAAARKRQTHAEGAKQRGGRDKAVQEARIECVVDRMCDKVTHAMRLLKASPDLMDKVKRVKCRLPPLIERAELQASLEIDEDRLETGFTNEF